MYNFFDYARGASYPDVLLAARTILVELQPVLDAALAEQLVAVVALFGFSGHLKTNLAQNEAREFFADFEAGDGVRVIAHIPLHFSSLNL